MMVEPGKNGVKIQKISVCFLADIHENRGHMLHFLVNASVSLFKLKKILLCSKESKRDVKRTRVIMLAIKAQLSVGRTYLGMEGRFLQ